MGPPPLCNRMYRTSRSLPPLLLGLTSLATVLYLCNDAVPGTSVVVCALALLSLGLAVAGAVATGKDEVREARDFLHPFTLALPGSLMAALRAIQLATTEGWFTNFDLGGRTIVAPLLVQALLLTLVGQLACFSGYALGGRSITLRPRPRPESRPSRLYGTVALASVVVAALAAILIVHAGGGVGSYVQRIGQKRDVLTGRGWLTVFIQGAPVAAAMFLVGRRGRRAVWPWLLASTAVLVTLMLGARSAFLNAALAVMIGVNYTRRRFLTPNVLVWFAVIGIAYVQVVGDMRLSSSTSGEVRSPASVTLNPVTNLVDYVRTRGSIDRFLIFLSGVPRDVGFQFGATYLRVPQSLVPRDVWSGKPGLTEANVYADLFEPGHAEDYATSPAGTIADYYLQFGVASVLLISILHGYVVRKLYATVRAGSNDPIIIGFYAAAILGVGRGLGNLDIVQTMILGWPVLLVAGLQGINNAAATRGRPGSRSLHPTVGR